VLCVFLLVISLPVHIVQAVMGRQKAPKIMHRPIGRISRIAYEDRTRLQHLLHTRCRPLDASSNRRTAVFMLAQGVLISACYISFVLRSFGLPQPRVDCQLYEYIDIDIDIP